MAYGSGDFISDLQDEISKLQAENKRLKDAMEKAIKDLSRKNSDGTIAIDLLTKALKGGKSNLRPDAYHLIEFGFLQCEKGNNLQGAFTNYEIHASQSFRTFLKSIGEKSGGNND